VIHIENHIAHPIRETLIDCVCYDGKIRAEKDCGKCIHSAGCDKAFCMEWQICPDCGGEGILYRRIQIQKMEW
jgi:hypothetical protein